MAQPVYPSFTSTYHHDQYPAIDPTRSELDCSGKVVIVTGGGRGIGKAISLAFAKAHAKGIVLVGRTQSTLDETAAELKQINAGTDVLVCTADIVVQQQVQLAFDSIIEHFGGVPDVLVNNAGGLFGIGSLTEGDLDDFWKAFEVNVKGPLVVTQAYLRANKQHSPDTARTVINIASGAAHLPYAPRLTAYSTSKLANSKIAEYLHHENPSWNVFNMQPGVVATDLARQAGRKAPDTPELPAGFAVWLATQPEARILNGRFVWANWDITELIARKDEIEQRSLLTLTLKGWAEELSDEELHKQAFAPKRDGKKKE
ncbi:hypothetical protein LTR36_000121 [Oleoguttula mirabilis]|uniref:NAD(P)-binding protein n=1 Tax=Oleoguttula mirabilis TaxID=1507867 RepID=A0AAV9JXX0_9PEZI|nr:hypothetical protein LTR36_000121 [Oleoguttula mirabilis]